MGVAKATSSCVQAKRSVLTRVLPNTELREAATVWSRSSSSRAAASVTGKVPVTPAIGLTAGMIWLNCGDDSRSQRTLQLWSELIWWSKRTSEFQTRVSRIGAAFKSGREGMVMFCARSSITRSTLTKKWALSRITGPPSVKPYCWNVVSGLGRLFFSVK